MAAIIGNNLRSIGAADFQQCTPMVPHFDIRAVTVYHPRFVVTETGAAREEDKEKDNLTHNGAIPEKDQYQVPEPSEIASAWE